MQVIKSENWKESFTEQDLIMMGNKIKELEEKSICSLCSIRRKGIGFCELETVCKYYHND
jgi:hypothetical protein